MPKNPGVISCISESKDIEFFTLPRPHLRSAGSPFKAEAANKSGSCVAGTANNSGNEREGRAPIWKTILDLGNKVSSDSQS